MSFTRDFDSQVTVHIVGLIVTCIPGKRALLGKYGIKDTNHVTFSADNLVSLESSNSEGGSNARKYLVMRTDLPVTSATSGLTCANGKNDF